eukprot:890684-Amphidinium_carterae.1
MLDGTIEVAATHRTAGPVHACAHVQTFCGFGILLSELSVLAFSTLCGSVLSGLAKLKWQRASKLSAPKS